MWRLQCGCQCHAECWGRNARSHVSRGRAGADVEVPCAICRGPGTIAAECPYAGQIDTSSSAAVAIQQAPEVPDLRGRLDE
eukprot:6916632-Pyramimonas_sp.AAC.1